jgi:hypothetical protein
MKSSKSILIGLFTLLAFVLTAGAFAHADSGAIQNTLYALAPAAIFSVKLTPDVIEDMKVKYGQIKIITVIVEPEEYDVDVLSADQLQYLKALGIDTFLLTNRNIPIEQRLSSVSAYLNDSDKAEVEKEKVRSIASGKVVDEGEKYQFAVRRPDRGLIKMLMPLAQQKKLDEFSEKGVKNLVVAGDMEALEDGLVFMGVVQQLQELIAPYESFLSKA